MTEQFLNQARLATRWQISPRTLERWRWTGEGPAFVKIGGRVVYRIADIEAYENGRRCDSTLQSTALRRVQ
jgi:predicted site-specific integrase-resolvase